MDYFEEFENVSSNSTFENEVITGDTTYDIVWEIIIGILCVFGICLNSVVIYTIFYYKKLDTVANIFIANWSIVDIFVLISLRSNYRLVMLMHSLDIPRWIINLLHSSQYSSRSTYLLFVLAVIIDWYLVSYFTRASQKFRKYYKFIIVCIWLLNQILLIIFVGLKFDYLILVHAITFLVFWIFNIYIYLFIRVQKCRKQSSDYPTLMLKLSTSVIMCWVPLWVSIAFVSDTLYAYIWPLFDFCHLAPSVVTFTVLYRLDKEFQACFQQAMKCSRNRYGEDISEFQNFPENITSEYQSEQPHLYQNGQEHH